MNKEEKERLTKEILDSIAIGVASDRFGASIIVCMQDKLTGVVTALASGRCDLDKDVCVRLTTS